jgi:hypothetical protein
MLSEHVIVTLGRWEESRKPREEPRLALAGRPVR